MRDRLREHLTNGSGPPSAGLAGSSGSDYPPHAAQQRHDSTRTAYVEFYQRARERAREGAA